MEIKIEDRHEIAGYKLIELIVDGLKERASSPELLTVLGFLAGQCVLKRISTDLEGSAKAVILLHDQISERAFELYNFMYALARANGLDSACLDGIELPYVDYGFAAQVLTAIDPYIQNLFDPPEPEDLELSAVYAIVLAINIMRDRFNEDLTGTLSYVTKAMVAGSKNG